MALGVSNQITSVLQGMGYSFKQVDSRWVHCSGNCALQSAAADSLAQAAASKNDYITLNSAFRTSAEQYLLYKWYQQGRCGITLAAAAALAACNFVLVSPSASLIFATSVGD